MSPRQLAIVSFLVAVVVGGLVVLLVTAEPPPGEESRDPAGDVDVGDGANPPQETDLADIRRARVYEKASQVVFEAQMGATIPGSIEGHTMEWRWEVFEEGTKTWLVSAHVSVGDPVAALTAQQTDHASSTIDGSFPGGLDHTGNTMFVRLNMSSVKRFPRDFTWRLITTLDADRQDPQSAVATDTAPAGGRGEYPPPP